MGEAKNRSVRLDDENYGWLSALPGRTLNDALTEYRVGLVGNNGDGPLAEIRGEVRRLASLVGDLPDSDMMADVVRMVISEFKSQKEAERPPSVTRGDPVSIPGISVGPPKAVPGFDCRCIHSGCSGAKFTGAYRGSNLCPACLESGHRGEPRNCPECNAGLAV